MAVQLTQIQTMAEAIQNNVAQVLVGKQHQVELALTALLAGGHVLLEDVPGTGKTMLARSLARSLDADFKRIQFTPDLLPSDLTGIHFYQQASGDFIFRAGPVFTNILLADEINRATPRTQSSLLECMEERQVTIDGETRQLAEPFFVIATQNPVETQGTYPLPEAQLDRFFLQVPMGYPDHSEGLQILRRHQAGEPLQLLSPVCSASQVIEAREAVKLVYIHEELLDYIMRLVAATRQHPSVALGVSPRGSIALMRGARVRAALRGRRHVIPDDIRVLLEPVLAHRLILKGSVHSRTRAACEIIGQLAAAVTVPTEAWQPVT